MMLGQIDAELEHKVFMGLEEPARPVLLEGAVMEVDQDLVSKNALIIVITIVATPETGRQWNQRSIFLHFEVNVDFLLGINSLTF